MFFAALFAMYFTIRSVSIGKGLDWAPALLPAGTHAAEGAHLNIPFATVNTIILVLSSVTCQLGVWAAEKGQVGKLRFWYIVSFLMGAVFVAGQLYEYMELASEGATLSANAYTSVFYLTTGFHGLHVTGGLIAFLFMLGRTYAAKRFTHEQATSAIVVSYYWHFVDVVWIGLFATIYIIR
ncbi:heme-copper oxidase subunit III [Actinomadura sp. ATCC 31491]|uniref:cytochrome-c oxidase n=2 Tax=Actinomadura luzonensis TaxID=2805427 RepID=A0ABT0G7X1_9ACTN|nr:heme-copper oxidase subunit III [Actinomadura luzonensis]